MTFHTSSGQARAAIRATAALILTFGLLLPAAGRAREAAPTAPPAAAAPAKAAAKGKAETPAPETPAPAIRLPDIPGLAPEAAAYRKQVLGRSSVTGNDAAELRRAREIEAETAAKKRQWSSAVYYRELAISLGGETASAWLSVADDAFRAAPRESKPLVAAWLAYGAARSTADRVRALDALARSLAERSERTLAARVLEARLRLKDEALVRERVDHLLHRLDLTKVDTDSDRDDPRACATFSSPLVESGTVRYQDYVELRPAQTVTAVADGNTLCVEGLQHGSSYEIVLRKDLPANDGTALYKPETLPVRIRDREPRLSFRGSAYILPRVGSQGLPLTSINVDRAALRVLRINDRNLINTIREEGISDALSRYDAAELADTVGEEVWHGEMDVTNGVRNREVTTAIPLDDILKTPEPGIYIVSAEQPLQATGEGNAYDDRATQWVVLSDIGLSSFGGIDGLGVFATSFATGKPIGGVTVKLIARNNKDLGSAVTDAAGLARFDPGLIRGKGGNSAQAAMAYGPGGDFSFLDLGIAAFDLTDRGVGGREAPGPLDAFLYTERGIYRPGETVTLTALLRDDKAVAVEGLPLTLRLARPDGVEVRRLTVTPEPAGAYAASLPFADSARTGAWTLTAHADPAGPAIGQVRIQIEDFIPSRMEIFVHPQADVLPIDGRVAVDVDARWLYGAPAAGLAAEGEVVLRRAATPYPAFPGFRFGLVQETFEPTMETLKADDTNADGKTTLTVGLSNRPDTSHPLEALVRATVFETGGRATARTAVLPVRGNRPVIGVKPLFDDGAIEEGREAAFETILLSPDGQRIAGTLNYTLYHEEHVYQWYREDSTWNYRQIVRDRRVASGSLDVAADQPAPLARSVAWGHYRLEVADPKTAAVTSIRFRAGWEATPASASDTPDTLKVVAEKPVYPVGSSARIFIQPPFAGEVLVAVAHNGLVDSRRVSAPATGVTIEVPVTEAWGVGAYVTATAFRPGTTGTPGAAGKAGEAPAAGGSRGPGRAVGVAWVGVDMAPRTLSVAVETPDEIRPRQTIEVPVTVTGLAANETAFLTLAAVDEGILQLTDYKTPDPDGYYYGKRRLAVELRDVYGRLIDGRAGARGVLRVGGDAAGRHAAGLPDKTIKPVSLFSGIVRLDAAGKARVPVAVPEFNGRLRLMAVAFDGRRVGHADRPLIVRDPVVAQTSLPRFLAPGDEAYVTVTLHNVAAPAGSWRVAVTADGAVSAAGESVDLALPEKGQVVHRVPVTGVRVGSGTIRLTLTGPADAGGSAGPRETTWPISVRAPQSFETREVAQSLVPGAVERITADVAATMLPGTAEASITYTTLPALDVTGLLKSLNRYPYGCLEQTTSVALPLLYLDDVSRAALGNEARDTAVIAGRIETAIGRVISMQQSDGGFGLWSGDGAAEEWLSAYAIEFLLRAREQGHPVPDFAVNRGLDWLKRSIASSDFEPEELPARAYALYALARAKTIDSGTVRYFHDSYLTKIPTALGRAQTAAALALVGDQGRAAQAFAEALTPTIRPASLTGDYGSELRDAAAVVALSVETGLLGQDKVMDLAERLSQLKAKERYLSTQEQVWVLLAAHALFDRQADMALEINGKTAPVTRRPMTLPVPLPAPGVTGVAVRNLGTAPVHRVLSVSGIPAKPPGPSSEGLAVERSYYTLKGEKADLAQITQGDLLIAVISGEALTDQPRHQVLIADLLPAGFDLENGRLAHGRTTEGMTWLPELTETTFMELRDDRFVAALDLGGSDDNRAFAVAYLVRAVTPGRFTVPSVFAEDMYRPRFHARQGGGTVTVTPRGAK